MVRALLGIVARTMKNSNRRLDCMRTNSIRHYKKHHDGHNLKAFIHIIGLRKIWRIHDLLPTVIVLL